MKTKKILKAQRKQLDKAVRRIKKASKARSPAWVTALAALAGAVATLLTDGRRRHRIEELASGANRKAKHLVAARSPGKRPATMPNGMVMEERVGPV